MTVGLIFVALVVGLVWEQGFGTAFFYVFIGFAFSCAVMCGQLAVTLWKDFRVGGA